jgi:glycine/D-amino acid oxidase-like deaminating enzyme
MYSLVIVGGGVAAASVVYHLYSLPNFKGKVLLVESGECGKGDNRDFSINKEDADQFGNEGITSYKPWQSGSNVFSNPSRIKMIVTIFPSTAQEFVRHHGMKGLKLYNKLASFGRDTEIRLAGVYMNTNEENKNSTDINKKISDKVGCIQLGSLMVCYENEIEEFKEEYKLLKEGGFEVEWWGKEKVENIHGKTANFYAGIFFPKDGIIDSATYAKKLIEYGIKKGLEIREKTRMTEYVELENEDYGGKVVKLVLDDKEIIYSKKVVMATGGLFLDKALLGILKPCYSYLTVIKNKNLSENSKEGNNIETMRNTPNFFTFGFSHDWSMSQGALRISGEDHFTALKNPRLKFRCKILEEWGLEKYPFLKKNLTPEDILYINGVYSETPDLIPLVGKLSDKSNVVYIVGCNAWGQASMSGAAYLVPALLGERKIESEDKELINFLDIKRFKTHYQFRPKF